MLEEENKIIDRKRKEKGKGLQEKQRQRGENME
jgi:hypothetical protein